MLDAKDLGSHSFCTNIPDVILYRAKTFQYDIVIVIRSLVLKAWVSLAIGIAGLAFHIN